MSMIDFYGGEMLGGEMLGGVAQGDSWMEHVAKVREANPTKTYKEVLQKASKSYKGKKAPAKKPAKKTAKKTAKKGKKAPKTKAEALIKALVKPKTNAQKLKAIENAMYLRERMFPVADSKNKAMKKSMEHLKKMGFNTKGMTKAEKVALSQYLAQHGRGVGQDVGSVVDDIFGFGGMALGGYPLGGAEMLGHGVGQDVGSVVDDIFGFGRMPRHMYNKTPRRAVRHKRGGFSLGDLAPYAALALL